MEASIVMKPQPMFVYSREELRQGLAPCSLLFFGGFLMEFPGQTDRQTDRQIHAKETNDGRKEPAERGSLAGVAYVSTHAASISPNAFTLPILYIYLGALSQGKYIIFSFFLSASLSNPPWWGEAQSLPSPLKFVSQNPDVPHAPIKPRQRQTDSDSDCRSPRYLPTFAHGLD